MPTISPFLYPSTTSKSFHGPKLSISLPLFNRGQLRRGVDLQEELLEQAKIHYRRTVLSALAEVEDALVAVRTEGGSRAAYEAAAQAAGHAVDLSLALYREGLSDFQVVLEAQRSQLTFDDLLAQSQAGETASLIRLYRALGGGWSTE